MIEPINTGANAVDAAFVLLPDSFASPEARLLLLAIGLQESLFIHRWQVVSIARPERMGPARGFWMFEEGGGCLGVIRHRSSAFHAAKLCRMFDVPATANALYHVLHMPQMDTLAAGMARLLLWTDPAPLPRLDDPHEAWGYYVRVWRPGAVTNGSTPQRNALREKFFRHHDTARAAM